MSTTIAFQPSAVMTHDHIKTEVAARSSIFSKLGGPRHSRKLHVVAMPRRMWDEEDQDDLVYAMWVKGLPKARHVQI